MTIIIEEIRPNVIIPETDIGMMLMQPFVELTNNEPYKWPNDKYDEQITRLERFFDIAKTASVNGNKAHFTILPEYSIPGLQGISKIHEILNTQAWPNNTIVIGGVDGLNKNEYVDLCSLQNTSVHDCNKPDMVKDSEWVNCSITWIKDADGRMKRYIQPKLSRSWPERSISDKYMFLGNSINLFTIRFNNQTNCSFFSLICFDWIGKINGTSENGINGVLHILNDHFRPPNSVKMIDFVFTIQNNKKPCDRNFLENARNFFEDRKTYPFINKDQSLIIFANTSGIPAAGKSDYYGRSSVISSSNSPFENRKCCMPSYSSLTRDLRQTDAIGTCKDSLLRENGACIHFITGHSPRFVSGGSSNRCPSLEKVDVYSINDCNDDPRTPGQPVPASIKWTNDEIDSIKSILHFENSNQIKTDINESHNQICNKLRMCSGTFLSDFIKYSIFKYGKFEGNVHYVDQWQNNERNSLENVIHSLSIFNSCKTLKISNEINAHASLIIETNVIDVIVVIGGNNPGESYEYGKNFLTNESNYAIVITKDINDQHITFPDRPIFEVKSQITDIGPDITNIVPLHLGFQNVKNLCFNSNTIDELDSKLNKLIGI